MSILKTQSTHENVVKEIESPIGKCLLYLFLPVKELLELLPGSIKNLWTASI